MLTFIAGILPILPPASLTGNLLDKIIVEREGSPPYPLDTEQQRGANSKKKKKTSKKLVQLRARPGQGARLRTNSKRTRLAKRHS